MTAGVDLGGTKIQTVVLRGQEVVGSYRVLTPSDGPEPVIDQIITTIRQALTGAGADEADLAGSGIGTPGTVDSATGEVSRSSNVPGFLSTVPLGATLSEAFKGVPVTVNNDVRVAVVGEYRRGAGRPFQNLLGVFLGTGVGGGLVFDGRLREGRGAAGEIGHMKVRDGGRRCPCGRRGCLEAYAGRRSMEATARRWASKKRKTRLFEIMEQRGRDRLSSGVIVSAMEKGDKVAIRLVDDAVWALSLTLASVQNLLDLEAIIVGGGLGDRLGRPFIERVRQAMEPHLFAPSHAPVMLTTQLGDLSGAVGAAVLAGG